MQRLRGTSAVEFMNLEISSSAALLLLFLPPVLLIPFCYAAHAYSPEAGKPLTRWKFGFIALLLTLGISVFIGILIYLLEAVTFELSHQLEVSGWFIASDIVESFEDFSLLFWSGSTLLVGFAMPSKFEVFLASVRG